MAIDLNLPPEDISVGDTGHVNHHELITAALKTVETAVNSIDSRTQIIVLGQSDPVPEGYVGLIARLAA